MAGLTFDGDNDEDYDDHFMMNIMVMIMMNIMIINRSLEMRELRSKRKGAKVSISSVVTEMTQFSEEV